MRLRVLILILFLSFVGLAYYFIGIPMITVHEITGSEGGSSSPASPVPVGSSPAPSKQNVLPVPTPPPVTAEELMPLPVSTPLLEEVPSLPEKRAPVVYLAPISPAVEEDTTVVRALQLGLRTHIRAFPKDKYPLNLIPSGPMHLPYRTEDGNFTAYGKGAAKYLSDAEKIGAEVFAFLDVGRFAESTSMTLTVRDLRDGSMQSWDKLYQGEPNTFLSQVISDVARMLLESLRTTDAATMDKMLVGLPSPNTWSSAIREEEWDGPEAEVLIQSDPECLMLYKLSWNESDPLGIVNAGLKKYPDNPELMFMKVSCLQHEKAHYQAFAMLSEMIRRYPEDLLFAETLPPLIHNAYPQRSDPKESPPELNAGLGWLKLLAKAYPKNWRLQWSIGEFASNFAWYVRGGHTVDKIPSRIWEEFEKLTTEAAAAMSGAIMIRSDIPELLRAAIHTNYSAGNTDIRWQRSMIAMIHQMDKSNVEAELIAAQSHSLGWGAQEDYLAFIDSAMRGHKGDTRAFQRIAEALSIELTRYFSPAWKAMTPAEAYGKNPLSERFMQCAEFLMDNGVQLTKPQAGILREIYRTQFGENKVREFMESGKHWAMSAQVAKEAHDKSDWEKTLKFARLATPPADAEDSARVMVQYYIVKSLWKLGRLEESLQESRRGFEAHPDSQVFHYMFAIVAEENGDPLEEAYQHAYRAIDIHTTNTGCNEVFEKIRTKLNKPPHPKLASSR